MCEICQQYTEGVAKRINCASCEINGAGKCDVIGCPAEYRGTYGFSPPQIISERKNLL